MSISPLFTTRRKFSFTKCSCIIPMIKLPQMDRQQAINIPHSFTKQYLSSCMSDTLGPVKITTRYGQDTNMQYYIAWTNLDRASISSMFVSESGYNCTISSGIPLSTILSFIVWRAHPVLISPSNILMAKWQLDMYIHVYNWDQGFLTLGCQLNWLNIKRSLIWK